MNDSNPPSQDSPSKLTRRSFLRSSSAAGIGAGLIITSKTALGQEKATGARPLNIAIIGCGAQGQKLRESMELNEPEKYGAGFDGITIKAVCDIWDFNRKRMAGLVRAKQRENPPEMYVDAEEMFDKHPDLDAVLVAVPDWVHHKYAIMALDRGVHAYSEKMMSNTIERAREMVLAQRRTGKLLQIGHQRRSNPRYQHLRDKVVLGQNLLGWMTHCSAQWNRGVKSSLPLGYSKEELAKMEQEDPKAFKKATKLDIDPATLEKYGYKDMFSFQNWRMFKEYGGGAISDLGAHQIDLYNWFFNALPKSVVASGGVDFYEMYEHYDNVMCIYEYDTPASQWGPTTRASGRDKVTSRGYYQVLTTTGSEGVYEKFMGEHGSAAINETAGLNQAYRESTAPDWEEFTKPGPEQIVSKEGVVDDSPVYHKFWQNPKPWTRPTPWLDSKSIIDARVSKPPEQFELPVVLNEKAHTLHLLNFFDTVRNEGKQEDLNCPAEEGFRTCVTVLKVNEAIANGEKVHFTPEDFAI